MMRPKSTLRGFWFYMLTDVYSATEDAHEDRNTNRCAVAERIVVKGRLCRVSAVRWFDSSEEEILLRLLCVPFYEL